MTAPMTKARNSDVWIEIGYHLFAEEGLEGLQVERLARIADLNKSGFYHHFGDFDGYCDRLLAHHEQKAVLFIQGLERARNIDPDFLNLLVEFKVPVMVQMQLAQTKNKPSFCAAADDIEQRQDLPLNKLWSSYLGIKGESEAAIRYFDIVRDTFYARITFKKFDYLYLKNHLADAKAVMSQLAEDKSR